MYTFEDLSFSVDTSNSHKHFSSHNSIYSSVIHMSTTVVGLIAFISEFCGRFDKYLRLEDFKELLSSLELCHWHALAFNENLSLRLRLFQISEEKSYLPHLLEQEVLSLEKLLLVLFSQYLSIVQSNFDEVFIGWIER